MALRAGLDIPAGDTAEGREAERTRLFKVLDDLVIAAGVPVGGTAGGGPLWAWLHQALEALTAAETYLGPIPLPPHHWR